MKLTGGEIIAEYLIKEKVPYVFAVPGHGNVALLDAFQPGLHSSALSCTRIGDDVRSDIAGRLHALLVGGHNPGAADR